MATIGTFKHIGEGEYLGDIFTLSLRATGVRIVPLTRTNDKAPSHRVYLNRIEIGAAWQKRSPGEDGRDYLSVKLDDPSFAAPIQCRLVKTGAELGHSLLWDRRRA